MSTIAYGTGTAVQPRLRITPRGRAVLTVLVVAPVLAIAYFLGWGATGAEAGSVPAGTTFEYVSVEPGQSLWQLAQQVAPQADAREVVADILALNNLSSADVQPGQELALPLEYTS